MSSCVHCKSNNSENWFYCRNCGKRASKNKYSENLWIRTERGKRTDVEFSNLSLVDSVNEMVKNKEKKHAQGW